MKGLYSKIEDAKGILNNFNGYESVKVKALKE